MGKKKAKRVKKAWRNISTEAFDQFNEQATRDANSGGSLASAPDTSLFVLDKSTDIPVKRKIEKNRERVVRFESILQPNPFVKPVPSSKIRKVKRKRKVDAVEGRKADDDSKNKDGKGLEPGVYDLWDNEGADNIKHKKKHKPSAIPAVEVEPNGCSYNPENESHKDSLAQAVAQEMKKVYKSELEPQPIPLVIRGEAISEEDKYFLEVDHADDEEMEEEEKAVNGDTEVERRRSKEKRVTRVELNRRLRRKEREKAEAEAKKAMQISKGIDSIPDILQEIAQEEEEKQNRHVRRLTVKEEKLKSCPPRLGKRKFEPAPVQVLLTEEITGSLRKLKACYTLARDRFKSLEKRGLIVPTANSTRNL
ncbi:ribosome biogenesis protein NOP53 [Silene latifolia]|uniref:ribosome biogenesis protein NOP53 n=1 Tax=Silene latifolia TaxID=37657 RepID=UPI003D78915D